MIALKLRALVMSSSASATVLDCPLASTTARGMTCRIQEQRKLLYKQTNKQTNKQERGQL